MKNCLKQSNISYSFVSHQPIFSLTEENKKYIKDCGGITSLIQQLTLAENEEFLQDCGGITSLIQQLTLTESEELSKTVKYLLQLFVSSANIFSYRRE